MQCQENTFLAGEHAIEVQACAQASVFLTRGPKKFSQDWPGEFILFDNLQQGPVAPKRGGPQVAKDPQATDIPRGQPYLTQVGLMASSWGLVALLPFLLTPSLGCRTLICQLCMEAQT